MTTGVAVSDECLQRFMELKLNKRHRWIEYQIRDAKEVVVVNTGAREGDWREFLTTLPKDDCRYFVFDFAWQQDGVTRDKILFITWSPDNIGPKAKMLYAGSKDYIRKKLEGVIEVQANDIGDLDEAVVRAKVQR